MPTVEIHPPFAACKGRDPFIFVSYSHSDGREVFGDIEHLHGSGFRIWYDEGIDPGNEWPDEIAQRLAAASVVLLFVSTASVQSTNVRNEIYFALNKNKRLVAVHLEETPLPPGLELRMGDIQAILKFRMPRDSYLPALARALPKSLRWELRPRTDLIINSYKVEVQVLNSIDRTPVKGVRVELFLIDRMRETRSLLRAQSTADALASGTTDADGLIVFGLLPSMMFAEGVRFCVSARIQEFCSAHALLQYSSPVKIARMTRDDEPAIVFAAGGLGDCKRMKL